MSTSGLPDKKLLRPDEVAKYCRVSVKTIYSWCDGGIIKSLKVKGTRTIRIPREEIKFISSTDT